MRRRAPEAAERPLQHDRLVLVAALLWALALCLPALLSLLSGS